MLAYRMNGTDIPMLNGYPVPYGFMRLNANGTPDATFNAHLGAGLGLRGLAVVVGTIQASSAFS